MDPSFRLFPTAHELMQCDETRPVSCRFPFFGSHGTLCPKAPYTTRCPYRYVLLDGRLTLHLPKSCNRCIKAKRICPGYKEANDLVFRRHCVPAPGPADVPKADTVPLPTPLESPPDDVSDEKLEQDALRTFIHDFCVASTDHSLSRGYLDGLEPMLQHLGPSCDVARAAKVVALTNLGNRYNRPALIQRAKRHYAELLPLFATRISDPKTSKNVESLMIAVILGFYEVDIYHDTMIADVDGCTDGY